MSWIKVRGHSKGSQLHYHKEEKCLYMKDKLLDGKLYLKCKDHKTCSARAIFNEETQQYRITSPNHGLHNERHSVLFQKYKLKQELEKKATNDKRDTAPSEIFNSVMEKRR